jgi:hypothetical protein
MEVMIASGIFLIASIGFTKAYLGAAQTHMIAQNYYHAMCISRDRVERLKAFDIDTLRNMAGTITYKVDAYGVSNPNGPYERTDIISTNVSPETVLVTVKVKFPDRVTKLSRGPVTSSTYIWKNMYTEKP